MHKLEQNLSSNTCCLLLSVATCLLSGNLKITEWLQRCLPVLHCTPNHELWICVVTWRRGQCWVELGNCTMWNPKDHHVSTTPQENLRTYNIKKVFETINEKKERLNIRTENDVKQGNIKEQKQPDVKNAGTPCICICKMTELSYGSMWDKAWLNTTNCCYSVWLRTSVLVFWMLRRQVCWETRG